MTRGTLFLVVGPSGAGKDSLIGGAAKALVDEKTVAFARRVVTRPGVAGGESHLPATADKFSAMRNAGGFMLHWRAHGVAYGVPVEYAARLADGCSVVVNVSRTVIEAALAAYAPVSVVEVTAPPALLAARLAARGREDKDGIAARLTREAPLPDGLAVRRIENTGTLEEGIRALVAALTAPD